MIPTRPDDACARDPTGRPSGRGAETRVQGAGGDTPTQMLARALDRGWERIGSVHPVFALAVLVVITVGRSGASLSRMDVPYVLLAAEAFPSALPDWRTSSPLGPWLAGAVGIETETAWFAFSIVLGIVAAAVAAACVARRHRTRDGRTVAGAWLCLASFPTAVLQRIGWYDVFTVTGAFLVVTSGRRSLALLGGVLIGLTNAEQGLVGLATAALVSVALRPDDTTAVRAMHDLRREPLGERLILGLVGLVVGRAALMVLFSLQDLPVAGRSDLFGPLLGRSMVNSLSAGGSGVFAWLGLGWGAVALTWFVRSWSWRRWAGLVASLVTGPALATVTTLDGSRVFAMVSLPGLLVLVAWLAERAEDGDALGRDLVRRVTVVALACAPVLPALITEPTGRALFAFPWAA